MTTSVLAIDAALTAVADPSGLRIDLVEALSQALHMATTLGEDVAVLHIQWAIDIVGQPISALGL